MRGVLLIGLDVSARLPDTAGGGKACPLALGVKLEPCARTTWLLMMSTGMSRIEVSLLRRHLGQRMEMSNSFSPSTMLDMALAPTALLTTLLTSAVETPHFWHFSGSTRNSRCDVPRTWKMPTLVIPWTSCKMFLAFSASSSSWSRSGPKILSELSPLTPDKASSTLSRIFCEKFHDDARNGALQLGVHRVHDFPFRPRAGWALDPPSPAGLRHQLGPVFLWPQRHEVLAAVITLGVRAVVGPAALGHDRLDLGILGDDGPRLPGDRHLVVQVHVERTDAAEPHVPLLQFRHELTAKLRDQASGAADEERQHATGGLREPEAELEVPQVADLQGSGQPGFP